MTSVQQTRSLLGHVHISKKFGIVYIDTPKVACSTIKETLQSAERGYRITDEDAGGDEYGYSAQLLSIHDRRRSPLKKPRSVWSFRRALASSRMTFCFVRNPFSRVLSAYLDKIANPSRRPMFLRPLLRGDKTDRAVSFVEFLELVGQQTPAEMNGHWRCQHYHNMFDTVTFDFIGAFENFDKDLHEVLAAAAPSAVSFLTVVDEHKTNLSSVFDQYYRDTAAVTLVRRIYATDFELLGYPVDPGESTAMPRVRGFSRIGTRAAG
jgi:hypothetical protein